MKVKFEELEEGRLFKASGKVWMKVPTYLTAYKAFGSHHVKEKNAVLVEDLVSVEGDEEVEAIVRDVFGEFLAR